MSCPSALIFWIDSSSPPFGPVVGAPRLNQSDHSQVIIPKQAVVVAVVVVEKGVVVGLVVEVGEVFVGVVVETGVVVGGTVVVVIVVGEVVDVV